MLPLLTVAALCASCLDAPQQATAPRLVVPQPAVDQQISEGCARFEVRFDAGGQPIVEPIYNTSYCQTNELKLSSDTAAVFSATTGALRVAIVMQNTGTTAVIPRVKLRFTADTGTSDLVGYQPDSSGASGRIAFWWYDQRLAASGQPQVLMPGAKTQRRWIEFRGTSWSAQVRLKLFATGAESSPVPLIPPDSLPAGLYDSVNLLVDTIVTRGPIVRNVIALDFLPTASAAQRQALVDSIGGTVIGGIRTSASEGVYLVRLPMPTTLAAFHQTIARLKVSSFVDDAAVVLAVTQPDDYLRPTDGLGLTAWDVTLKDRWTRL